MLSYWIMLSAVLFGIGAVGVIIRRNVLVVLMCIELMLNGTNLALVSFSRFQGNLQGQVMAFFVIVVAAAEAAVGLAIIISLFRTAKSVESSDAGDLKG